MQQRILLLCSTIVLLAFFAAAQADVTVKITTPEDGSVITPCIDMLLQAEATATAGAVTCYIDDIRVIDRSMSSVKEKRLSLTGPPAEFELEQAYPNPFNMTANIRFTVSEAATVSLDIFNMQGEKVRTLTIGSVQAGRHTAQWNGMKSDGRAAPSGVYIYRLVGESLTNQRFDLSRKIVLLK